MQSAFPLPILGEGGVILHCDNPCILTSCAYRPVALPRKPSAVENRAFAPAWLNGIINSVLVITPWSFPDNYRVWGLGFGVIGFRVVSHSLYVGPQETSAHLEQASGVLGFWV